MYNVPCDNKIDNGHKRHSILASRIWIDTRVRDSGNYLAIMASGLPSPTFLTSPAMLSQAWSINCFVPFFIWKRFFNKTISFRPMQSIEQKMDVSLTTEAITKIATRSYEISISSLWTNYLIWHEDSLEIWATRAELMGQCTLILIWLYLHIISFSLR